MHKTSRRFILLLTIVYCCACSKNPDPLQSLDNFYKENSKAAQTCLQYATLFGESYDSLGLNESAAVAATKLLEKHQSSLNSPDQQIRARFLQIVTAISLMSSGLRVLSKEDSTIAFLQICRMKQANLAFPFAYVDNKNPLEKAIQCEKDLSGLAERKKCVAAAFFVESSRIAPKLEPVQVKKPDSSCFARVERIPEPGNKVIEAATCGDVDLVRDLLDKGAPISAVDQQYKKSSLHYATERGHTKVVEFLLERGADANSAAVGSYTPLVFASVSGHVDIINILLRHGVNPNQVYLYGTPLIAAVKHRNLAAVKALVKGGADVNLRKDGGDTALHHLVSEKFSSYQRDEIFIEYLMDHGADPRIKNHLGKTVLDIANPEAKTIIEKSFLSK